MPGVETPPPIRAPAGLTSAEAARRLATDGPNVVPGDGARHWLRILGSQIGTPLVLVLIVAAALSRVLGERTEAAVILLIVALNALLGFVQEHRAERALRALQSFVTRTARVRRDGVVLEVPAADLVRGDLVELQVGDLSLPISSWSRRTRSARTRPRSRANRSPCRRSPARWCGSGPPS